MNLIEIRELYKNQEAYLDKEITVGGWVRSIRDSKAFGFIVINDGTFFTPLQVVYHDDMENFEEISKLFKTDGSWFDAQILFRFSEHLYYSASIALRNAQ